MMMVGFLVIATPEDPPSPRHLEKITYDTRNKKLLLFGGAELVNDSWMEPPVLWEWNDSQWTTRPEAGPSGRRGHAFVFDEEKGITWLIGGVMRGTQSEDSLVFDVWSWNNQEWKRETGDCPVSDPVAVYDPTNKRILVYGLSKTNTLSELWEFHKHQWNKLSSSGPAIRNSLKLAYDQKRNCTVAALNDGDNVSLWEWKDLHWKEIAPAGGNPPARSRFAFSYDAKLEACLLFGGLGKDREPLNDMWSWNGNAWHKILSGESPSPRSSTHLVGAGDRLLLYGGSVAKSPPQKGTALSNELWEWKNNQWRKLSR
jgi:hypothetical protein